MYIYITIYIRIIYTYIYILWSMTHYDVAKNTRRMFCQKVLAARPVFWETFSI